MADDQAPVGKPDQTKPPKAPTAKVNATNLNLRDDASETAAIVAVLPQGTPLTILTPNEDDSWVMVTAVAGGESRIGWVKTEFITQDGISDPPRDLPPGAGTVNPRFPGFLFTALVGGGFFSSEPDNLKILRAIRTNNPGAINDTVWQHARPGYVTKSIKDSVGNETAIYSSPEYGVASWYTLLADHYKYKDAGGAFTLSQLAHNYAGRDAPQSAIDSYITDWTRLAESPLTPQSTIHLADDSAMLNLALAVFKHESRSIVKINSDQILFGIRKQRTNTLPAPPKPA
ncbi:MAG TPA: hypothetical protein VH249_24930 [Xanthobacteraceae bacterium]|jgi:hypothetical protein|nr:hypothetical protein [Xanthobacteraceae bacterium]